MKGNDRMLNQFEHNFKIRRVTRTTDEDYITALRIYNETTPYEIKTSTNEITHWIDSNNALVLFDVYVFVLYIGTEVIGLSMTTYLKNVKVVVDEYLALKEQYRVNTAFMIYFSLIQNFFSENSIEIAYFITEISNRDGGKSINKESSIYIKILCLESFGKVDALYYALPLGIEHFESNFEAFLYIKSNDIINNISKETYLAIVKSIYYDYFYVWYTPFLSNDQLEQYKRMIDTSFNKIKNSISPSAKSTLDVQLNKCLTSYPLGKGEKTHGFIPAQKRKWFTFPIVAILLLLILPVAIIWGYTQILQLLGIEISSVNSMVGAVLGACITAFTAQYVAKK